MIADEDDSSDEDISSDQEDHLGRRSSMKAAVAKKIKEDCESTAMIFSPGKVIMTPNSQRIPSPNKCVSILFSG
jgi:hypothetical protein